MDAFEAVLCDTHATSPCRTGPPPEAVIVTRMPGRTNPAVLGLSWPVSLGVPSARVSALDAGAFPTVAPTLITVAGSDGMKLKSQRGTKASFPGGSWGPPVTPGAL